MTTMTLVRQRSIGLMQYTLHTLTHLMALVDDPTAVTLRDPNDGEKGWTILEILCHLRDFDEIFHGRALLMRDQEHPQLLGYDHEALAHNRDYNSQNRTTVLADLQRNRAKFIAFFQDLSDEEWERGGVHPERDSFDLTDAVMQVGLHDAIHIEQITRILTTAPRL